MSSHENALNTRLCDILVGAGIKAKAEITQANNRRIDIECYVADYKIAIEAEHGYSTAKKHSAIKDADAKLDSEVCDLAIALVYPEEYESADSLRNGSVQAHIRTPSYRPSAKNARWRTITVNHIHNYVNNAPSELGSPDVLASRANQDVRKAARVFSDEEVASTMGNMGNAVQHTNIEGLMTDLLTAFMFHVKLDIIRNRSKPDFDARCAGTKTKYSGTWPPKSVRECLSDTSCIADSFFEAHYMWLAVDYKQILEWSCAVIRALPASPSSQQALSILAKSALDISSSSGHQHHDLIGITFCQSVETAKSDGSMYTTIPAAVLLVNLLFHDIEIDWTDFEQITQLRIVDFACGTGTLLIAVANYILQHEKTGRKEEVTSLILERMIYGFDINNRALFQTATGLGMIAPAVGFSKMHLYSMLLGIEPKTQEAKLGSLELIEGLHQLHLNPRPPTATRIDAEPAPLETDTFSIAIMNPPFTRSDLRHKQFKQSATEKKLRDREKELFRDLPPHLSSNSNGFFVLAEKYLGEKNGHMAFVAPTVMATNPSALTTRIHLAKRFHLKYIVISYDPKRPYQSGNTDIGEILVVLDRKSKDTCDKPTTIIKLTTNPTTASEATACVDSIAKGSVDTNKWGFMDSMPASTIASGDWSAVQFANSELYHMASRYAWTNKLGNHIEVAYQGSSVRTTTRKCRKTDVGATPALYDHKADYCNKLEITPDCYVCPKPGQCAPVLQKGTRVHLPERLRLTTTKTVACRTPVAAVGSAWGG